MSCFAGIVPTVCVSSVSNVKPDSGLVELRNSNKHLQSERQSSMKIPLARQGSGWVVGRGGDLLNYA